MLLSIVMMVKNEENYLHRTLKALNLLMEEIESELIILDTGSTDNTIEIARQFTDKIYFSKWNKNFADMRNKSISYAEGDWILILDADEVLTNYNKLIEFFTSDNYKKYNSATIQIKNILSNEGENEYDIISILRLFKNTKDFKYIGKIHEQPLYKKPVYKNIAEFNHYGYLFADEEFKQRKLKRNEELLLDELRDKPDDGYINYQLAKNYMVSNKNAEALIYMEKAYEIHEKHKNIPEYIYMNLSKLYLQLGKYLKAEKICLRYLKNDKNNVDIYYYLATSQNNLGKYEDSINNYERYIYLVNNYEVSTQYNSMFSDASTINHKDNVIAHIIHMNYILENYERVIERFEKIKKSKVGIQSYYYLLMSLYRTQTIYKIKEYYDEIPNSTYELNQFKMSIEKLLLTIKEEDRPEIYKILANLDGDYGRLNKIRLIKKANLNEYKDILKNGKYEYYGDLIGISLSNNENLLELLYDIEESYIKGYLSHLVSNNREVIFELYKFLYNAPNTLDIKKLKIYRCLSRVLIANRGIVGQNYKTLFLMYITYNYDFIRQLYKNKYSNENLIEFISDVNDKFILKLKTIKGLKNKAHLEYVKRMKELLYEYPEYKDEIKLIIDEFEKELNENEELKILKKRFKSTIEEKINLGHIEDVKFMINEYESMFKSDLEILNIKAIIEIMLGNFNDADLLLKQAYILDSNNNDVIFNIGYVKEHLKEVKESIRFYKNILLNCQNEELLTCVNEKINALRV